MEGNGMKKLIFAVFAVLAVVFATPCYAADATLTGDGAYTQFGVNAVYSFSSAAEKTPVTDGTAQLILPDNTVVSVSGVDGDEWYLVVYAIPDTDTEAVTWINSVLDGKLKNTMPFYIYLENESGACKNVCGVQITVQPSVLPENCAVYSLNCAGECGVLSGTASGYSITFISDGSEYYVLGTDITSSSGTGIPSTGDDAKLCFMFFIAAVSSACAAFLIGKKGTAVNK